MNMNTKESATLGGGCFWCLDAVYRQIEGVSQVLSGYAGGDTENPTYREVCSERTGHAEVVQVEFDPQIVTFRQLLEVFFTIHDPTTLNRQGNDSGTQYRSIILYHNADQKRIAEETISEFEGKKIWRNQIVTELAPLEEFYVAEDYHQDYYANNPGQGYCRVVVAPKVAKAREKFLGSLIKA